MKNNKTYVLTYLFTLIGGVLLTIFHSRADILELIIILIGILFLLPSIFSIIGGLVSFHYFRKNGGKRYNWLPLIPAVAGIIFGMILMIRPDIFKNYLIITFGILLILCGLIQLFNHFSNKGLIKISGYYLIIPSLTTLFGIFILILGPEKIGNIVTFWTGIALICYSINGLIGDFHKAYNNKHKKHDETSHEILLSETTEFKQENQADELKENSSMNRDLSE